MPRRKLASLAHFTNNVAFDALQGKQLDFCRRMPVTVHAEKCTRIWNCTAGRCWKDEQSVHPDCRRNARIVDPVVKGGVTIKRYQSDHQR